MSKVEFITISPEQFFIQVQRATNLTSQALAKACSVHPRTLADWKRGRFRMPLNAYLKLSKLSGITSDFRVLPDFAHTSRAGKLGGARRHELYGNPGTPQGRRRGGQTSAKQFEKMAREGRLHGFQIRLEVPKPPLSEDLAEMIGILLGDGHVGSYQTTVTLHRSDDWAYANYVVALFKRLFATTPAIYERASTLVITVARTALCQYLRSRHGLAAHKVTSQVGIPPWINRRREFVKTCIRGLVDTDGCFYVDKHTRLGKKYFNPAINFTNRSLPVLNFVKDNLANLGFHPTQRTPYSLFLRREDEVKHYFAEIGSSNPKHLNKFNQFITNKHGGVPKRS